MSTKTSIKRIALVAVSALGFGLLSVVPAKAAAAADGGGISAVAAYSPTVARVDSPVSLVFRLTMTTDLDDNEITNMAARFTAGGKPSGSVLTAAALVGKLSGDAEYDAVTKDTGTTSGDVYEFVKDANATAAEYAYAKFEFTPDVAGTYSGIIWNDANGDGVYQTSEVSASWTITTAGAPTKVTLTNIGGDSTTDSAIGALVKVTLTDAAGKATTLADGEFLVFDPTTSDATFEDYDGGALVDDTLTSADFTRSGIAWVHVVNATAELATIVVEGDGDLDSSVKNSIAIRFRDTETVAGNDQEDVCDLEFYGVDGVDGYTGDDISISAQTVTFLCDGLTADADTVQYANVVVTDLKGQSFGTSLEAVSNGGDLASGAYTLAYEKAVSIAKTKTTATFTVPFLATTAASNDVVSVASDNTISVDRALVAPTAFDAGTTARLAVTSGSVSVSGTLSDQFGNALANYPVTMSFTGGRNAGRASIPAITDASGAASLSYTDASVTATSFTDTLDFFSGATNVTGDITITYTTVSTGTLTVDADATTLNAINTDSAKAATVTLEFTALDANSAPIVGLPIVVAGVTAGAAVSVGSTTVYTGADGTATADVYSSKTGTISWTGTASLIAQTATATRIFVNDAGDAKVLAIAKSDTSVTATVTDNFGNAVKGVNVDFSRTGSVSFGGLASITAKTNASGVAEVLITGTGTVTAALAEADYPKSAWIAGYLGKTATATASTSAVAGVASKSVDVAGVDAVADAATAAADAALEAIDAANAATDAANLAAEAADAATVAAEEARDAADAATAAVEALASEVATLIAGLKAQLTTLAKTVAKIAKKVRA